MVKENLITKKPPYLLGILCAIPLVGAFVGMALILYGIFKYKDRLLIFIGTAGLVISICVYSLLFYNLKYGKSSTDSFSKISEKELNELVQNIEYYKLVNGNYPDSLEQLKKGNETINIYDPLLIRKMDNSINTKFEYKKMDSVYTLFSSGNDGIPYTSDDIYPSIVKAEAKKIGLRK